MEWKELELGNLPADILTGDYEFEGHANGDDWGKSGFQDKTTRLSLLSNLTKEVIQYRYRKPEP